MVFVSPLTRTLTLPGSGDAIGDDLAILPFDVHGEVAPRPQAGDAAAGRPGVGQGGQQINSFW